MLAKEEKYIFFSKKVFFGPKQTLTVTGSKSSMCDILYLNEKNNEVMVVLQYVTYQGVFFHIEPTMLHLVNYAHSEPCPVCKLN